MNLSEIVLGGTYGFVTISFTVFAIISGFIGNSVHFRFISLKRYHLLLLLFPLIFHSLYFWLIFYFPFLGETCFVLIESFLLIVFIFVQSSYILEPYYNTNHFKSTIIRKQIDYICKKIKSSSDDKMIHTIESEINENNVELSDNNSSGFHFNQNDYNQYYLELLKKMKSIPMNSDTYVSILDLFSSILFQDLSSIKSLELDSEINLKYLWNRLNNSSDKENVFSSLFFELYNFYMKNKDSISDNKDMYINLINEYKNHLILYCLTNKSLFNELITILFSEDWNSFDCLYLSKYYRVLIPLSSGYINQLSKESQEKIQYFKDLFSGGNYIKKYGNKIDENLGYIVKSLQKEVMNYES